MSAGRAPWRYVKCDPLDPDDEGDLPLDYDNGWESHYENPCIVDADDNLIVGHDEYHVFGATNRVDNLRLLLAAPDLLKAAQQVLAQFDKWQSDYPMTDTDFAQLRAAVAKTTGEP